MRTYSTSEVAKIIKIHPNTVRLYEKLGLIPQPERKANGYRVFTDFHIEQLKLARMAFKYEVMPATLQKAADILPLTQGIKLLKASCLGLPAESVFLSIMVMSALAIICIVVSISFFKWE